jgi:23S rRNA pseudouridine1911/1915/1917 synthase
VTELQEEVPASLGGERIDRVVAMLTGISRTEASELVKAGGVRVDGATATRGADRLEVGARVAIDVPEVVAVPRPEPDPSVEVPVVFADEHLAVIDKPADLVVHPGAGHVDGTLVGGLLARWPEVADVGQADRPGIVHRLDRGTSGLLVVARSTEAYDGLVDQLGRRAVERRYRALVWGHPESPRGLIDAPIGRSPRHPTKMAVTTNGKEARTRYEVDERFTEPSPLSLVTCRLETGRTHQIRVHLAAIGHAVVGDDRYHGVRQSLPMDRPFLHAEHLAFVHPVTGEALAFDSPMPADLLAVLARVS